MNSEKYFWNFRNPFSEYPNIVADKPNSGPKGPLTKIFSDIPAIFFGIYERYFLRVLISAKVEVFRK